MHCGILGAIIDHDCHSSALAICFQPGRRGKGGNASHGHWRPSRRRIPNASGVGNWAKGTRLRAGQRPATNRKDRLGRLVLTAAPAARGHQGGVDGAASGCGVPAAGAAGVAAPAASSALRSGSMEPMHETNVVLTFMIAITPTGL